MLYKFRSEAAGDLIMLEPTGRTVLGLIGKPVQPKGIITVEQMPAAIAALQAAVQHEREQQAQAEAEGKPARAGEDRVSLRQRVQPFVAMLQRCQAAGKDVVWGV